MNYFILNKEMKTVAIAQTDSSSRNAFHVLSDVLTDYANAPSTLEVTFDFYNQNSLEIKEGAYIVFQYEGAYRLFQIKQVEEVHADDSYVKAFAEESSYELLDAVIFPKEYAHKSAEYLLGICLADTDWAVGEVADVDVPLHSFSAYGTALNEVQTLATEAECKLRFRVKYTPQKGVTARYVDLLETFDIDEGKRLEFGRNVNSVKRIVDRTQVCTAVIPVGSNDVLAIGFDWVNYYDDKTITKEKNSYYLAVDEETRSKINPNSDAHLFYPLMVESTDKSTLCQKAYEYLKNHKEPKYTYEVDAITLRGNIYTIGEKVRIIDDELGLSMIAEVEQTVTSFCDPDSNSITLSNYVEKKSNVAKSLYDLQNKLQTKPLDNPLVVVSPDKPLIEQVGGQGTVWFDTSQNANGIVILNKYDIANGEWITIQQTPSTDNVGDAIEEAKKDANLYAQVLASGRELAILKGDTFPTTAEEGQLFLYTVNNDMYRWNGTEWVIVGTSQTYMLELKESLQQEMRDLVASADIKIHVSENPPEDTNLIWHDTANDALKMHINGKWQVVSTTEDNIKNIIDVQTATKFNEVTDELEVITHTQEEHAGLIANTISKQTYDLDMEALTGTVSSNTNRIERTEESLKSTITQDQLHQYTQAELDALKFGKRNYFAICNIEKLAMSGTAIVSSDSYRGFAWEVIEGEEWTLFREGITNNRWEVRWFTEKPANGVNSVGMAFSNHSQNAFEVNRFTVPQNVKYGFIYLSNQADEIPNIVLEKGNVPSTSWYPSVEDEEAAQNFVAEEFVRQQTLISQNQREIGLRATTESLNTLTGRVSKNEGDLRVTAENITQAVNRIATTEQGLEQANASIRTNAESIEARATKKELEATNSTIRDVRLVVDANTGAISQRATHAELKSAVDNIDIGGRNLASIQDYSTHQSTATYDEATNTWKIVAKAGNTTSWGCGLKNFGKNVVIPYGKTVVISFEIKVPKICKWNVDVNNFPIDSAITAWNGNDNDLTSARTSTIKDIVLTNQWIKHYFTYSNTDTNNTAKVDLYDSSNFGLVMTDETSDITYYIRNIKAELGNKPTDWSPCPLDTDRRLGAVEEATFTVLPNQISSKVTQSVYDADMTTMRSQINTVNSSITQKANEIALQVAQSEFDRMALGGNNLLQNARFRTDADKWNGMDYLTFEEDGGAYCAKLIGEIGVTKSINQSIWGEIATDKHGTQEYTVSAWVKCDNYVAGTTNPYCSLYFDGSYNNNGTATWMGATNVKGSGSISAYNNKGWSRIVWTMKFAQVPTRMNFHLYFRDFTGTIKFRDVKVERGNKVTDWSPNQNELGDYYANLETRLAKAEFKLEEDAITATVLESTAFDIAMQAKADSEALADLATPEDIAKAIEDADIAGTFDTRLQQYIKDPQSNINLHFVTSAKWSEEKDNINAQFGYAGGLNLLRNSCGMSELDHWTPSSSTAKTCITKAEDLAANQLGLPAAFQIINNGSATYITQVIDVVPNRDYTLSCYINKLKTSSDDATRTDVYVQFISGGTTLKSISLANATRTNGYQWYSMNVRPTTSQLTVRVYGYNYTTAYVSGIMVHEGTIPLSWNTHTEEVYNSNVRMDINGIKVIQQDANKNAVGYTSITPSEFAGYYDTDGNGTVEKIFYLNQDAVISKRSVAQTEIIMGNLKFVNLNSDGYNGWALVPSTANDWSLTEGTSQ